MRKLLLIFLLGLTISCGNNRPHQPERLPDDEIPAYRTACLKIADYIVLEDSAYHLTISKQQAAQIGVPEKYYDRIQQELDYTNYLVREEYNKKGIPIEMPEFPTE